MPQATNITGLFWRAAEAESGERSPRDVVRHSLRCLEAFDAGKVVSPKTGKPVKLMELLADMGMEEDLVYASPELARGESFDERSLVFTLGVLIFERLTGRHPFGTSDTGAKVARIRRGEMGSGVNYFPQVPADLRSILMRAMGPFPEERFTTLAEMKEALRRFGGLAGLASVGRPKFFDAPTQVAPPSLLQNLTKEAGWGGDKTPATLSASPEWMAKPAATAPRQAPEGLAEVPTIPKAVTEADLEQLFDDDTDEQGVPPDGEPPGPAGDPPTSSLPLVLSEPPRSSTEVAVPDIAGSALRPQPLTLASPASRLMPLLYVVIGAALASVAFLVFYPRTPQVHEPVAPGGKVGIAPPPRPVTPPTAPEVVPSPKAAPTPAPTPAVT